MLECLAQGPGLGPQHPMKLGVSDKPELSVSKRRDGGEGGAAGSEVQGHSGLNRDLKASLGCMRQLREELKRGPSRGLSRRSAEIDLRTHVKVEGDGHCYRI